MSELKWKAWSDSDYSLSFELISRCGTHDLNG